jgi:signal transduction histidine kinase/CheY-like chemotaxis protein
MSRQAYPETDAHLPEPPPSETMRVERRHASGELDLHDTHERLLTAERLAGIGTLAAGAAHEINNPLTYALLNVDHALRQLRVAAAHGAALPLEDDEDVLPPMIRALEQAQDGMQRVRSIVRNLLTFSRGAIDTRSLVDVRAIVESSIQMAMHEIVHRACVVREFGDVPPVEANEAALGQVFINLLVNAAQAIPEGGPPARHTVRVATFTDANGSAVVEVQDTGVGIPPDVLPRIFDPFFTSKTAGTAMGLGLSISHGTITRLGGTIDVTSTVGHGTRFRVALPASKRWRRAPGKWHAAAEVPERRRVLVIDDDRQVGEAIARVLCNEADVELLTEGRVALDRLVAGERWDVVLCDLMMPDCSGVDVYAGTVERAPDAAGTFVFMTAGAFTPRTRAFLENVSRPCLEKPLDAERIREIVRRGDAPPDRPSAAP